MAKRMMADVLWEAANVHLHRYVYVGSCIAVAQVLGMKWGNEVTLHDLAVGHTVFEFLSSLGCQTDSMMFLDLEDGDKEYDVQGARYMWLILAMHVAEDEGLMV